MDNRTFQIRVTSNGFVVTQSQEDGGLLEWVFESVASLSRFFGERTDIQESRPKKKKKVVAQPIPLLDYPKTEE